MFCYKVAQYKGHTQVVSLFHFFKIIQIVQRLALEQFYYCNIPKCITVLILISYILTLKFIINWANILCSSQVIQQKCNESGKMFTHSNSRCVGGYGETLHRHISSTVHGRASGEVSIERGGNFVPEKFNKLIEIYH
jgi:hypothetical protein